MELFDDSWNKHGRCTNDIVIWRKMPATQQFFQVKRPPFRKTKHTPGSLLWSGHAQDLPLGIFMKVPIGKLADRGFDPQESMLVRVKSNIGRQNVSSFASLERKSKDT